MLMDNKGGSSAAISGGSGENIDFLKAPEFTGGEIDNTDFLNEKTEMVGEDRAEISEIPVKNFEAVPSDVKAEKTELTPKVEKEEYKSAALSRFEAADISHEMKKMPKAVVTAFTDILKENRNDPHHLAKEYDEARWVFIERDFHRKIGDGLTAKGRSTEGEMAA